MFKKHASAEMLFEEAKKKGLNPCWESVCGLFSFSLRGKNVFVYYSKLHINSQLGAQICQDKSLTRAFLARGGFPNIPFCYSKQRSKINLFFDQYHPIIQKPLLGMRSQNVRLISNRKELDLSDLENTLFEQYIEGTEYRCLVLNETIVMQKKKARS